MPITRINHFEAKSGREAELKAFLESVVGTIRSATGCRSVELLVALDRSSRLSIVETWDSVEAHQAAAKLIPPAMMQAFMPLLASPPNGEYFRAIGSA
jgi:quinol monooxygenase YgiN